MSLARIKTWIAGEILTAADLNGEFNNILNNPISLISPTTGVITFSTNQTFPVQQVSGGIQAGSRVKGLNGTLSSQTGTFTADQYVLQTTNPTSSAGSFVLNSTGSFTVNVGTAGPAAGGRDIAAVFASTYVHWYAITTGHGSTAVAGIVSTQTPPTGPVMPTSYSAWSYLGGSIYSSASTAVSADHRFRGAWAHYDAAIVEVANGNTTVETAVALAAAAPPNHLESQHSVQSLLSLPTQQLFLRTVSGSNYHATSTTASAAVVIVNFPIRLPNVSNQFFYLLSSALASATDGVDINIQGYKMPNGGE